MIFFKTSKTHYNVQQYKNAGIIATIDNVTDNKPCYIITFTFSGKSYAVTSLRKAQSFVRSNLNQVGAYPVIIKKNGYEWITFNNVSYGTINKVKRGNRLYWYNRHFGWFDHRLNKGLLLANINYLIKNN